MTGEIKIVLDQGEPVVYFDGQPVGCRLDITYAEPPASPLTVASLRLRRDAIPDAKAAA
jgi:hypothetical protein